jgi:hypothetical protein
MKKRTLIRISRLLLFAMICWTGMLASATGEEEGDIDDILYEPPTYKPAPIATAAPKPLQVAKVHTPAEQVKPFEGFRVYHYMPNTDKSLGTENHLSEICREIAGKVYYELKENGEKHLTSKIAVVAAVPLSDLKRHTEFGRVMAEYLLTDMSDRGIKVSELRLGKEIHILPQTGEFVMSRNPGELANSSPQIDYVVVSTYTNTRKTLIYQGRLVSLKSGLIETSWRYTLPLNRELLGLFHTVEQQPFTIAVKGMKR